MEYYPKHLIMILIQVSDTFYVHSIVKEWTMSIIPVNPHIQQRCPIFYKLVNEIFFK